MKEQINNSILKYIKAKQGNRPEISMTNIIMIKEIIRIGIDEIMEIEEFSLVVQFSMDKILQVDHGMNKTIGMMLEEEF